VNINFQSPELLLLLILLIPLPYIIRKGYQIRQNSLNAFTREVLSLTKRSRLVTIVAIIFLSTLLLQAAGPRRILTDPDNTLSANFVFLIDVSRSMAARVDCDATTRLDRAKVLMSQIVSDLPGARFGFAGFSGLSFVLSEMSYDRQYLFNIINNGIFVEVVPLPGSDIANALHVMIEKKQQQPQVYENVDYVILISDGDLATADINALESMSPLVREANIELISIGVGSDDGTPIPTLDVNNNCLDGQYERADGKEFYTNLVDASLREIADETGGEYFHESKQEEIIVYLKSKLESLTSNRPPQQTEDLNGILLAISTASLFLLILLKRL
jgi:Ca-activated chloride channel family protein